MGPITLIALLAGLMMTSIFSSDDDTVSGDAPDMPDEPQTPDMPEDPVVPDDPMVGTDTGATFMSGDNAVSIELGEDETGSLAVINYIDTEDREDPDEFVEVNEARFYLVPEGVDWSDSTWETQGIVPGATEYGGDEYTYYLADFEEHFGLELLGVVDLNANPDGLSGGVTANAPVTGYALEANTDGDELIGFLPDDAPETRGGVEVTNVTQSTTGTDGVEWFSSTSEGIALDGAGGDDFLDSFGDNATLIGGAGNDVITGGLSSGATAEGGEGDDRINLFQGTIEGGAGDDQIQLNEGTADGGLGDDTVSGLNSGTAYGGDGDDVFYSYGDSSAVLYGQNGDDRIITSGTEAEAYGGAGNDFISLDNGATGFGGEGNDTFQLDIGATADGGTGDDVFNLNVFATADAETAILTGGAGADEYTFSLRNPFEDGSPEYMRITDFDPTEDTLLLDAGYAARVGDITVEEAPDGSYSNVIVEYIRTAGNVGSGISTAIIRLDGVSGYSAEQLVA